MKFVKKGYGSFSHGVALAVITVCGLIHCSTPAWAEDVVNQAASQEAVKALDRKLDIVIDALTSSGQLQFSNSLRDEINRLNQHIAPENSSPLVNPRQTRLLDMPKKVRE